MILSSLPRYPKSWFVTRGGCGALLDPEAECSLPDGHLDVGEPHSTRGPYGNQGQAVRYDDTARRVCGVEVFDGEGRKRWCAKDYGHRPEPKVGLPLHEAPAPPGALYPQPWMWWGEDPWRDAS